MMAGGYTGKILRLNLTDKTFGIIETSRYEEYGGGIGIGTAIFWDLVADKAIDAFDPRNVVTVMTSPLTGTLGFGAAGRMEVNGIGSQAYPIGWFTRSNFGGRFGAELKSAGWDGIVIEGKSDAPVWINIINDRVVFEEAKELWGQDTYATTKKIWAKVGRGADFHDWLQLGPERDAGRTTQRPAVLCIGPIGEAQVRDLGCLVHDAGNTAGQGGFGAVWGSKKLKAISVMGTGAVKIADPKALAKARLWAKKFYPPRPEDPILPGATHFDLQVARPPGALFWGKPTSAARPQACMGCFLACRQRQATGEANESMCTGALFYNKWVEKKYGALTEEANKAIDLAQKYGANAYPLLYLFTYLFTLKEMGVLGPGKAIETDLDFDELGSSQFVKILFDKIVEGQDIGLDLREGIVRAAKKWGRLEDDLKTGLLPFPYWGYPEHGYDGRGSLEWGYGTILSDRDINEHEINSYVWWYPFLYVIDGNKTGAKEPMPLQELVERITAKMIPFEGDPYLLDYSDKNMYSEHIAKLVAWQRYYSRFWKQGICFCDMAFPEFYNSYTDDKNGMTPEAEPRFFNAVTGKNISFLDGMKTGRKVWNIHNAIWTLQGRHRDMVKFADYYYETGLDPAKSFLGQPPVPGLVEGKWTWIDVAGRKIDRDKFEEWKTIYYQLEGWDPKTGWPTRATLEELGLDHVADELERKGKLGLEDA